jgi:hypothetical protein
VPQSGTNTLITLDASDQITLATESSLAASQFRRLGKQDPSGLSQTGQPGSRSVGARLFGHL